MKNEQQKISYMKKPAVYLMIIEAVDTIGGIVSYHQIKEYINNKWPKTNSRTIEAQIAVLCVNLPSRIHFPENNKVHIADPESKYDKLFHVKDGVVEKYSVSKHGFWEVYYNDSKMLAVRKVADFLFSPSDIIWIKNVSNIHAGQAYMDNTPDRFVLDFPNKFKKNAGRPKVGDLILLYQRINNIPVFSHLVTPLNEEVVLNSNNKDYPFGRVVQTIAKTSTTELIKLKDTLWARHDIRSAIQGGNVCNISNINKINIDLSALILDVWQRFLPFFLPIAMDSLSLYEGTKSEIKLFDADMAVQEGTPLGYFKHLVRERNRDIVIRKKTQAESNNQLFCEVCGFSFIKKYNQPFIECHHKVPIGSPNVGNRITTLDDLALVCANCHRMLHKKIKNKYLSIGELSLLIRKN